MRKAPIQILVVEDSESDFDLLELRVAHFGFEADLERVEDESGMRAALVARAWDLVISDHRLPRFSHDAALRVLREHDPDIPLIVVSGAIGEEAAVDMMLAGADDFIMKGNLSRLAPAITRSINSAATRRGQRQAEEALRESESMLRSLAAHLERVKETERAAVAREIHDDIGAIFFALKVDVAWLRKRLAAEPAMLERLASLETQLDSGVDASQRIARSLRPAVLDFGVVAAAEWLARDFAKRTGIACRFDSNVEELALAPEQGTTVFRVLQESLTNISRHAGANEVGVTLSALAGEVRLEVKDNGRGLEAADLGKSASFGVRGMRARALDLGGSIEIARAAEGGTLLELVLPLRAPVAGAQA